MSVKSKTGKTQTEQFQESAAYACGRIKELIEQFGPRAPGSPAEYAAQKSMAEEMSPWVDDVKYESFTVHRQAFMGFIPFTVLTGIISVFSFWFNHALLGLITSVIGTVPLILEFLMYRKFVDFLFPGHPSHNVIAVKNPQGEVKRRIVLAAHADSQYEWTLNRKLGGVGMKLVMIPAIASLFVSMFSNLLKWILADHNAVSVDKGFWAILFRVVGIAMFALFPAIIGVLFFQNPFRSVPGATDNLSGCYVALCTMRELARAGIRMENTQVVCLITGSEEAGLRGAKDYVKRHKKEMQDIPTICLGLDTFRDIEHMAVYDRDMSGTVKHDGKVRQLLKTAAGNCGYDLPFSSIYIGACDAAAFTQGGIPSTGFAAMDPTPPKYYHTRLDNWDILEPQTIAAAIAVTTQALHLYDAEGLC